MSLIIIYVSIFLVALISGYLSLLIVLPLFKSVFSSIEQKEKFSNVVKPITDLLFIISEFLIVFACSGFASRHMRDLLEIDEGLVTRGYSMFFTFLGMGIAFIIFLYSSKNKAK